MKYMGSKARYAKHILPIILKNRKPGSLYVEPFVGGANTFHLVESPKLGNDSNIYVVAMLSAVANGWEPPSEVSEEEYNNAKTQAHMALKGFIGIGCSYSGKFFGGYARGNNSKGGPRNYARESRDNILKQAPGLREAQFSSMPYWDMTIPDGSTVYCDPPYRGTTQYKDSFDSDKFWAWAGELSASCDVFVSEYTAPEEWSEVWSKPVTSSLTKDTGSKLATEKLFVKEV